MRQALRTLEVENQTQFPGDPELAARIASYELAARMQLSVPEATNLKAEPTHIRKLYGADSTNEHKAAFAENCILARRLIERGVRFVQLFNGAYATAGRLNWDAHSKIKEQYDVHGEILDQQIRLVEYINHMPIAQFIFDNVEYIVIQDKNVQDTSVH